jgi:phosphoketolase
MPPTFEIFTDSPGAQPEWIESAQDLEDAKERLRGVACIAPRRDCFIYSNDGGIVEVILRADFQGLRKTYSLTGEHNNSRSYRSFCADLVRIPNSN